MSPFGRRTKTSSAQPSWFVRTETNRRTNNEDSYLVLDLAPTADASMTLLAIADGMGGYEHGEDASREVLRSVSVTLFERLVAERSINQTAGPIGEEAIAEALRYALEQTNGHIQRLVATNNWGRAGSTVAAAIVHGDVAVVANLGDSPLFHYRSSQRELAQVTEDHTVAGVLLRAGLLAPDAVRLHAGRSQLEFYVGCATLPEQPPLHRIALQQGDRLLLCSDGVSGSLTLDQIAEIFGAAGEDLEATAGHLIDKARAAGETDNQTLILWQHGRQATADQTSRAGRGRRARLAARVAGALIALAIGAAATAGGVRDRTAGPDGDPRAIFETVAPTETVAPPTPSPAPTLAAAPTSPAPSSQRRHKP